MDKQELSDKAEAFGRSFKTKATSLVTNKFWVAVVVLVVILVTVALVF